MVGCRPVYDVWGSSYQPCNSSEQMKRVFSLNHLPQIMEPCQSADKIVYEEFDDQYFNFSSFDTFGVWVDMRMSRVKVIEHKQAYNLKNLIGNTGGYIGLFLGTYYIHNCNLYTTSRVLLLKN